MEPDEAGAGVGAGCDMVPEALPELPLEPRALPPHPLPAPELPGLLTRSVPPIEARGTGGGVIMRGAGGDGGVDVDADARDAGGAWVVRTPLRIISEVAVVLELTKLCVRGS